jgi:DNA repair protein RadC
MPLDAESLVQTLAAACDVEGMLVIGLDARRQLCGVGVNPHHRALSFVKVWELAALVEELDAHELILAVFPNGGDPEPTAHERTAFADLCARAHRAQVMLSDCIVVRGDRCWSLREMSFVDHDRQNRMPR